MIGYLLGGIFIRRCHLVASHRTNTFFSWPEERVKGLDRRTQMTSLSYIQRIINVRAVDRRNANLYTLAILTRGDWWVPPMVACSLNRYPDQWNVMPTIHCAPCQHITDVVLSSVQACGFTLMSWLYHQYQQMFLIWSCYLFFSWHLLSKVQVS